MSKSVLSAIGFGKLWKTYEEITKLTGLPENEVRAEISDLQTRHGIISANHNEKYVFAMAARIPCEN